MGEMADYALDCIMNDDERYIRLRDVDPLQMGDCDRQFMFDYDGTMRPPPVSFRKKGTRFKNCAHCGKTGLRWKDMGGRWRLLDNSGKPHTCQQYADKRRIRKSGGSR